MNWPRPDYDSMLKDSHDYKALQAGGRRHPLTMKVPWSMGEPCVSKPLPYTGTQGAFRIYIGPKPLATQRTQVELIVPGHDEPLDVRVNGIPCRWSHIGEAEHITASGWKGPSQGRRQVYDVPEGAVSEGYNLIEVIYKQDVTINWVEIAVK
jgi:hypothetical protein